MIVFWLSLAFVAGMTFGAALTYVMAKSAFPEPPPNTDREVLLRAFTAMGISVKAPFENASQARLNIVYHEVAAYLENSGQKESQE